MKGYRARVLLILLGLALLWPQGPVYGWPWSKDMHRHPSLKPGELPLSPPEGTLPVEGGELPMSTLEAGERLKNPVLPEESSLANGKKLFDIYCAVCHGLDAKGNGPVAGKFFPPPDLTLELFKQRTDGFIYGTITNGGPVMPAYAEDILPGDRWDLVNYIRRLQGK